MKESRNLLSDVAIMLFMAVAFCAGSFCIGWLPYVGILAILLQIPFGYLLGYIDLPILCEIIVGLGSMCGLYINISHQNMGVRVAVLGVSAVLFVIGRCRATKTQSIESGHQASNP